MKKLLRSNNSFGACARVVSGRQTVCAGEPWDKAIGVAYRTMWLDSFTQLFDLLEWAVFDDVIPSKGLERKIVSAILGK